MRLTESSSALRGSASAERACRRSSDGLQVVLHAVVDLLREHAPHDRPAVLERDGGVMCDRSEQRPLVFRERRVAIADELTDLPALPAERQAHRVRAGAPFRPGDVPVLEHERGAGRVDSLHRRLHDRLERLLEVQRLGDRLRDLRQRFQLRDPPLGLRVELGVLDRLRHLRRNRDDELDLVSRELPRLDRADVEGTGQPLARDDRHGEDRFVLILRQVREELETRIEVRLRRDHDRRAFCRRSAGDALARTHAWTPCHLLDARAVRCSQHELVGPLVVEVDKAGVGAENVGNLARHEPEHLLEIERRVDGRDRLREQTQMAFSYVQCRS
jgi:hypothetical protein